LTGKRDIVDKSTRFVYLALTRVRSTEIEVGDSHTAFEGAKTSERSEPFIHPL